MDFLEAHEGTTEVINHQDQGLYDMLIWLETRGHVAFF